MEPAYRDAKMGHLQALDGEDQDVELVCLNYEQFLCFLIDQIQVSTVSMNIEDKFWKQDT